jgi:hypothetical protein
MPQTKVILDSTCYFRLAQNIHPLLGAPFGKKDYTLYAHEKLVAEFNKQPRLQTKFDWFLQNDYVENRKLSIRLGRKERAAIDATYGFMWPEAQTMFPLVSPADVRILATASELRFRMVTDDQDLYKLAEMYGVHVTSSLEMMRLMLDEGHITMDKVEQVVAQWEYDGDKPANFRNSYIKIFGRNPPVV